MLPPQVGACSATFDAWHAAGGRWQVAQRRTQGNCWHTSQLVGRLGYLNLKHVDELFRYKARGDPTSALRYLQISKVVKHSEAGEYERKGRLQVGLVLERVDGASTHDVHTENWAYLLISKQRFV